MMKYFVFLLLIFFIVVSIKLWMMSFYLVSSESMSETLLVGDIIAVERFKKEVGMQTNINYTATAEDETWNSSAVRRNDVIVFARENGDLLLKRCAGLPGDTVMIKHNFRYANSQLQPEVSTVMYSFEVVPKRGVNTKHILQKYGIPQSDLRWEDETGFHISAPHSRIDLLRSSNLIDKISIDDYPAGYTAPHLFPFSRFHNFSLENFGPIIIPKKHSFVVLNDRNINLYRDIIDKYECNSLVVDSSGIRINGKRSFIYQFNDNYFFVLGDNRGKSIDSRFLGFVPESSIVGKARFILCSYDVNKNYDQFFRWDRFFSNIE